MSRDDLLEISKFIRDKSNKIIIHSFEADIANQQTNDKRVLKTIADIFEQIARHKTVENKEVVRDFAKAILHGDEEHKKWLLEAAEAYIDNQPLPPSRHNAGIDKD